MDVNHPRYPGSKFTEKICKSKDLQKANADLVKENAELKKDQSEELLDKVDDLAFEGGNENPKPNYPINSLNY